MRRVGSPEPSSKKAQSVAAFTQFIGQVPKDDIIVYTDGSKLDNGNAGAGFVISQSGILHKEAYSVGSSAEIFDAEAIAALLNARAGLLRPTNRVAKDLPG